MVNPQPAGPAQHADPLEGTDLPVPSALTTERRAPRTAAPPHGTSRRESAPKPQERRPPRERQRGPSLASQDKTSIILGEAEFGRRKSGMNRPFRDWATKRAKIPPPPPIAGGALRVVPLGGCEELGKSLVAIETAEDLVVIDAGLQWPDASMHGVDYLIADVSYVRERAAKLRAILLTGPHDGHAGGLATVLRVLDAWRTPVVALPLTAEVARLQLAGTGKKVDVRSASSSEEVRIGKLTAQFVPMNSNVPDSAAIAVRTPLGTVVVTGSYKVDHEPADQPPVDLGALRRIGDSGVLVALVDAAAASQDGYQMSEQRVGAQLDALIGSAKGRVIIGTSETLVTRISQICAAAAAHGRKVWVESPRMGAILDAAVRLGRTTIPPGVRVDGAALTRLTSEQLVVVTSGAESEHFATLGRIVRGEHAAIQLQEGDTVAFSPSLVGTNLRAIEQLMNRIYLSLARMVQTRVLDPHSTGHARAEETKLLLQLLRPKVVIPHHGSHSHGVLALQVARQLGYTAGENALLLHDGSVLEFAANGSWKLRREMAPARLTIVDGHGVGDVGESVLKDRESMAEGGVVLVLARMDRRGALRGAPTILTYGFVHVRGADELLAQLGTFITKVCTTYHDLAASDQKEFKFTLQREVEKFLFQKTERQPIVLPLLTMP